MKRLAYLFALVGLVGLTALVIHEGAADVMSVVAQAGWPLLLLLPLHALPLLLDAQGWRTLLHAALPHERAPLPFLWWTAMVREAVNRLLPTASVGGELVGIRLARLRMSDTGAIAASIVTEVMVTMFSYYAFTVLGVLGLLMSIDGTRYGWAIIGGLVLSLAGPIIFALALHHGAIFARLGGLAQKVFGDQFGALGDGAKLDAHIKSLVRRPGVLLTAMAWQLGGLLLGTAEVWFALTLLGHEATLWQALFIEALTQAARQMAFFVPAGLGVQEAVVLMLGEILGISSEIALSLALVKRAREILFGVPALLSWQWLELHRWKRSSGPREAAP
ncbi:lysylphosphatidylglycerol synthase domain-containing protein [Pseudoduganella sp. RAF19]|uniref:lysylphosphatidylglycerol synthase domain-containing protein n=1 Tax=Pseudoduganella sp. RAF19 TaxID=3233052 RepID=UPI003F96841A